MEFTAWYLVGGAVLITMALAGSLVKRLPLTPSMLYLTIGVGLGPYGAGTRKRSAWTISSLWG